MGLVFEKNLRHYGWIQWMWARYQTVETIVGWIIRGVLEFKILE